MKRVARWVGVTLATGAVAACAAETAVTPLTISCARVQGEYRLLHGINSGPIHAGETLDLSALHRAVGVPLTRLHDCHWPSADVVDLHVVFPDFRADPSAPGSYDFRRTDDYVRAILETGSQIVYRLGESIEHTKRKYHVHPPADPERWAAVCMGIIRHYNEGWADGFRHNIRYWEIWNEPENRPAMWTGSDDDYFRLYSTTAKAIKKSFPHLQVGGPAVGNVGRMVGEALEPSPFVRDFLEHCRRDSAPLDFFSWHTYTADPEELVRRAHAVRRLLDQAGFPRAESHLNEWNYLPDGDWAPMLSTDAGVRQQWCQRIGGAEGAAFTAAALVLLQNAPLDAANYYSADIQGFGMFNEYGVPKKSYHALRAFKRLLDTPSRLTVQGSLPGRLAVAGGMDRARTRVTLLASNYGTAEQELRLHVTKLPWNGTTLCELAVLDAEHDLGPIETRRLPGGDPVVSVTLKAATVVVIGLGPAN